MLRLLIPIALVMAIVGVLAARRRARRHADTTPDLHQHPERLEPNLDSTDDA
jgi:hypothetical protein